MAEQNLTRTTGYLKKNHSQSDWFCTFEVGFMLSERAPLSNPTRECGVRTVRESGQVRYGAWGQGDSRELCGTVWCVERATAMHSRYDTVPQGERNMGVSGQDRTRESSAVRDRTRALIRPPHRTSSLGTHALIVSNTARTITLRYYSTESGCATPHSRVGLLKESASGRRRTPHNDRQDSYQRHPHFSRL